MFQQLSSGWALAGVMGLRAELDIAPFWAFEDLFGKGAHKSVSHQRVPE